ncbi:hypothetical protein AU468_09375 [Alkalispirochaeta sphaeroplastigenens]|uniref:histidine kinase n=1 Tax=Alkalispirochaeta sphaeroplastigenens TaxID=1187066 RepID=A0A2S4JMV1_9SPIO|nr:hypothetical protein AU468_09375 [Alkalispirochaeta sphaeroplastigenens]
MTVAGCDLLVVDSRVTVAQRVQSELAQKGYAVSFCVSLAEALQALRYQTEGGGAVLMWLGMVVDERSLGIVRDIQACGFGPLLFIYDPGRLEEIGNVRGLTPEGYVPHDAEGSLLDASVRTARHHFGTARAHRATEQELLKNESLLRFLSDSIPAGMVYQLDAGEEGNLRSFTYVSAGVESIHGLSADQVMEDASALYDQIVEEDRARVAEEETRSKATGEAFRAEFRVRHPSGDIRWVAASSAPRRLANNHLVWDGLVLDVTEQKKAEAVIRESERRLASLMANLPGMAYRCRNDQHWTMEFLSEGCLGLTGYTAGDLLNNRVCSYNDVIHPDYRSFIQEAWERALADRARLVTEYPITTREGLRKWVWEQGCGVYADSGEVVALEGFITDITDRKAAEEAIRTSERNLEAKNRELEQLVYVASHDLRSPLVNVDGFSRELEYSLQELEALSEGGDQSEAGCLAIVARELPEMALSIKRIRASTVQMDRLLKGLLKLSRLGRAALQIGPVDMNELMQQLESSFSFRLGELGVPLQIGDLPRCRGDATQVMQVFSNLIDNALKYLDRSRPGIVSVEGAREEDRAVYRVSDNGVGISEHHQEKVFELFHRLDPRDSEGEGIGLTAVRQILFRLEGEIRLESIPGAGSTFIVSLPACGAFGGEDLL